MQKKIMAVAVAGALASPAIALAQSSTVQIYGTIFVNLQYLDREANRLDHDMLNTHDSGIGFKGEERLGGGLSAWFQCESTLNVISGGDDGWCGRNSAVGFKGGFGNVFFGLWDVPLKNVIAPLRPFSTSGAYGVGSLLFGGAASDIANGVAGGNNAQSSTSFSRRQKNLISYHSPNWSGFGFQVAMSTTNEATGQTTTAIATKPRMWSLGANYASGPLYIGGGYENHKNYNPGALAGYIGGDDSAWNIGAAYTFAGVFKASFIYTDSDYETNAGGTINNLDTRAWAIYGDWAIAGPHRLRLGYTVLRDTDGSLGCVVGGPIVRVAVGNFTANCGAGGTGSKLYNIMYTYAFSKRTEVSLGYARVDNDSNARHVLQSLAGAAAGETGTEQSAFVFSVRHTF